MLNPFIYGLISCLFLFSLLLKYAIRSINLLQLELDKQKNNSRIRVLNYISKNILKVQASSDFFNFLNLSFIIIYTLNSYSNVFHFVFDPTSILISILVFIIFMMLIITTITIGEYFSNKIIYLFAIPLVIIHFIILPFSILLINFYRFNIKQTNSKQEFNKHDLEKLVSYIQLHTENSENENTEIKLFQNALEFLEVKVRECIIPRTELISIEIDDSKEDLKQKFISSGHSKILVYKNSIDNIIGFIKSKCLFSTNAQLKSSIKSLPIFPESMNLNKLLKYFIRTGQNMAVIVDEFGGTSGIVTTEDILEEIFGEIKDEHDTVDLYEKRISDTSYIFSGRLEIDYINDKYNFNIPEEDEYETIAGFILSDTENIPKLHETIDIGSFRIKILKVSNTRVELVKLDIIND